MEPSSRTACFVVFLATSLFVKGTLATELLFRTPRLTESVSAPSVHPDDITDDRPWENCTNLLQNIAEVTALFELCALMNAKPFTMCMNCAGMYGNGIGIFYQLTTNVRYCYAVKNSSPEIVVCSLQNTTSQCLA
ncbi:hypothetical protein HPB51_015960 [Rhipicephalus microplus]|uniref:Uncharacterized protein n=1 Tax=Rhipicephalus microplus TaxID=6941 RepID=A0A9J6DH65_RHIMP|nr:hypothetical protein HPB51_015960 [Rhipicephalus microplus]